MESEAKVNRILEESYSFGKIEMIRKGGFELVSNHVNRQLEWFVSVGRFRFCSRPRFCVRSNPVCDIAGNRMFQSPAFF
ncbi:hypothetical protein DLM78_16415 [Leptospira stimsonii]|uniref:Uncharacterized protein n=1 Tax=Leptospira stimsonii TaxID=2202203 RepID=A0A8B3CPY5_9LEPT|nr:hypothetical protein DLM78_16415 [Leptospira stimsonii]